MIYGMHCYAYRKHNSILFHAVLQFILPTALADLAFNQMSRENDA